MGGNWTMELHSVLLGKQTRTLRRCTAMTHTKFIGGVSQSPKSNGYTKVA